jgi:hypothetical protein
VRVSTHNFDGSDKTMAQNNSAWLPSQPRLEKYTNNIFITGSKIIDALIRGDMRTTHEFFDTYQDNIPLIGIGEVVLVP